MKKLSLLLLLCIGSLTMSAQDFTKIKLKSTAGDSVSLSKYKDSKALVVVFTSVHCVYAKKYEARLGKLIEKYRPQGVQFVLVNSNNPSISEEERFERMVEHARTNQYSIPYLSDPKQKLATALGAEKNPEVFVFRRAENGLVRTYRGAIDDNPLMETAVRAFFLQEVLDGLIGGNLEPSPEQMVKGCYIKRM